MLTTFLFFSEFLAAQNGSSDGSRLFVTFLTLIVVLIAFVVIIQVADNLMRLEAKKLAGPKASEEVSLFPKISRIFNSDAPKYVGDAPVVHLKRGYNMELEGAAEKEITEANVTRFAIQPPNFHGIAPIPKVMVEIGAEVKAGDPLLYDKKSPSIIHAAPVSGEVIAVNRGAKRAITEVVILADKEQKYREFEAFDLEKGSRDDLVNYLLGSGVWPLIRQRPYHIIANPEEVPVNIFVSTFDTAPLAPDLNFVVQGNEAAFQKGLDVLGKLTSGKVHLGLSANDDENPPAAAFTEARGVEKHWFRGPHPTGNVGVQIHHIAPITPQDVVWTMGVQEVITLGKLFLEQKFIADRVVAIVGSEVKNPGYVRTKIGANIGELTAGRLIEGKNRLISGDVLTGEKKAPEGFLNIFDDQVTVIEEGDYYEPFGWLLPQSATPSISPTFPYTLFKGVKYEPDTNTHGEKRAFVVTGQYESVLPMDIYVQHLMKSILVNDFEKMEGLGIYELVEEDVALCEFACTSKQPLQQILRDGLNTMYEEG